MSTFLRLLPPLFILALVGIWLFSRSLPEDMEVERAVEISAPASRVFTHIGSIRGWKAWFTGPDADVIFDGPESGPGGHFEMKIEGRGLHLELTETSSPTMVAYETWEAERTDPIRGVIQLDRLEDGGVQVVMKETASISSTIGRWPAYLLGDYMIGGILERQLGNLKSLVEQGRTHADREPGG